MKKLSLFLLVSVFAFCGCSDDDDAKTYVLSLPNYETHTLDLGDTKNPVDQWSTSYEYEGQTYITSNPQLSSSASFLRLNVLSSLN